MSSITIPPSTIVKNHVYNFYTRRDKTDAKLTVSKKESGELVYSVAIKYLGKKMNRSSWAISFKKDDLPKRTFKLLGSNTISFKVADENCIRICEIDERSENIYYADLTAPEILLPLYLPIGIRPLVALAKQFVGSEGAILYHDSIVLITREFNELQLLAAEPGDTEFTECDTEEIPSKDDNPRDVSFTATFKDRIYTYASKAIVENNIVIGDAKTWEGIQLKSVS